LNDAYRLPSVLWKDLQSLCAWLTTADLHIDANWFQAHLQERFPLQQKLEIPTESAKQPILELRSAYRSTNEKHQFSLIELKLKGDDQDRFDVVINGWTMPMKRNGNDKIAAVKTSNLYANLDLYVYDKWLKETVLKQGLRLSNGSEITLDALHVEDRRMVSPPPHPDLSYILDLAWAEHWGGNGRRF